MSAPYIRLTDHRLRENTLEFEFDSSLGIFLKNRFFVRYEGLRVDAPEGLRLVPFAALMAPLAMATGAALSLPVLDKDCVEALEDCGRHWRGAFPRWGWDRYRLETTAQAASPPRTDACAMLFSCGLDSLATYLHNRSRKPHLFVIFGADIPLSRENFIAECRSRLFDEFARAEGVGVTYIHTDVRQVTDSAGLKRFAPNWYASVQFGLLLAGLTAPVTSGRFSELLLASCSHRDNDTAPCAADPGIIRGLRWGGTRVRDHLHELTRPRKIGLYLKKNPEALRYLRVCWEQFETLNCSRCKKCLRTICELLVNGVDPNRANFRVDERTLPALRERLSREFHLFFNGETPTLNFWRDIQEAAAEGVPEDLYGSREFFRWLQDFAPLKQDEPKAVQFVWSQVERARRKLRPLKPRT